MVIRKDSLKYYLFETLAHLGDFAVEFLLNEVPKGKRVYLGRRRYTFRHFRRVFKELTTTGYIERVNKNGIEYICLTPKAKTWLHNEIPLPSLQKRRWDGYFRGLAYDFPEKQSYRRDRLREHIRSWGMGLFQRSLWITPHPLEEPIDDFIAINNLSSFAQRFMTKKLSIMEGRLIAERVWKIDKLEKAYYDFAGKWMDKVMEKKLKPGDLASLRLEYSSLLRADPHLPFELLPADWPAEYAQENYLLAENAISKLLQE